MRVGPVGVQPEGSPLDIVAYAVLGGVGYFPEERRPYSRRRQALVTAHPELMERELNKMSNLAAGLAAALRQRGVTEPAATLAAESGVTVFRLAFEQWVASGATQALVEIEAELFAALRGL